MSEQTKLEPDIVERLEAAFTPSKSGVLPSRKLYREAADAIRRLRAERPGWRDVMQELLDSNERWGLTKRRKEASEKARALLALHPSVAEGRGENEKI